MAQKITRKGPGLAPAQKIGDIARSALYANKPDCWFLGEMPGDDFGYDFQATAFDPDGEGAQCAFTIQLKGTTQSKARLSDGSSISYPFDRTTLQLWHRSGFAVIVVIVDLIDTQDQKEATVYYHFANYDLENILSTIPEGQKKVNLHVPTAQVVAKDLDILPIVLPYLDEIADARQVIRDRNRASGATASERMNFDTVNPNPYFSPSDVAPTSDIEEHINVSSDRDNLRAALSALRTGDYDRVLELCPRPLDEVSEDDLHDVALATYLRALAMNAVGDSESFEYLLSIAETLFPECDDIIGMSAQAKLDKMEFGAGGQEDREELLDLLTSLNGISVSIAKSKIHALNGEFDCARELLSSFPACKIAIAEIVISTVERDWARVIHEVDRAKEISTLRPKQRLWLEALESRAYFELSLQNVPRPSGDDFVIPSTGLPEIDYEILRLAYLASKKTMLSAQRLNWPADIVYVLDVFSLSAMILGYTAEAMPLLTALGIARAPVTSIREIISKFAVQIDQQEFALELFKQAGTSPKYECEDSVMAVATLKAGRIEQALEFVNEEFLAESSSKDVHLSALIMLGMAAHSALRGDLLEKICAQLDHDDVSRHYRAILESAIFVSNNLLQRFEAVKNLHSYWSENEYPAVVGFHLLTNLNPIIDEEASLYVEVAKHLESENSLGEDELADYGQALITIDRVDDAIIKLQSASERFRDHPKIQSLLGISLEINGRSPEAFALFEKLLNEGNASDTARRYFIEIAARMGFFDRAEQQVRAAFSKSKTREQKLRLLNTLFQLLLTEGKQYEELEEVAWEYGKYAKHDDEREEGIFLQEYLVATIPENLGVKPERVKEFQQRLNSYSEKFPKSRYLWRAEVPIEGTPQEILKTIQQASGISYEDIEKSKATEQKMNRGALEVPFSWRPRKFLRNVSDVFMLWEIRRRASLQKAALHIRSTHDSYKRQVPTHLDSRDVVISLTSLMLLDELNLLSLVLKTFRNVIVARATMASLQKARNSFSGGWGREKSIRIIEQLQEHFSKVSHPPYGTMDHQEYAPDWYYEEVSAMKEGGKVYFSDDIVESFMVCNTEENDHQKYSISTVDFLTWADQSKDIVSPYEVADAIAHMVQLNVMSITVDQRYFLASIPVSLNQANSQAQAEEIIDNAQTYKSILDGVWHHDSPFKELVSHFAANMSYLVTESRVGQEVLVSLWLRWLRTVRFQHEPKIPPINKMGVGFIQILDRLEADREIVGPLWQSFWTAIYRGFCSELDSPEDQVGIAIVAKILGTRRAVEKYEASAMRQFEIAKAGLESGTERDLWLNNQSIEAMAEKELNRQSTK